MAENATWVGGLFFIVAILLFFAAYQLGSYGFGLFGLASMMIAAVLFLYGGQGG